MPSWAGSPADYPFDFNLPMKTNSAWPGLRRPASWVAIGCFLITSWAHAERDLSAERARQTPQWVRDGVVYEIFPRNFSAEGNFNGITARLDELKDLGVNILWLMPIHPLGEKLRKGTLGSPYAVRDYYAINPDYGTEADL